MTPILSEEQRRALHATNVEGPIEVIDPTTKVSYVLVRADHFARLAAQADPYLARDIDQDYLLGAGLD